MAEDEIDVNATVAQARKQLSDSAYRRRYRKADFITYSTKQLEIINSKAPALFVRAANQSGKSEAGAGTVKILATQEYPADYHGWVQPKLDLARPHSCEIWCISPTMQMARDTAQSRLLGDVGAGFVGTGVLPASSILSIQNARGVSGTVDSCVVRRRDGTTAVIRFKSAEAGREAMQGSAVDLVWVDEMCPMDIWSELLARLSATSGRILLTATPLKQQSDVAAWFREPGHSERQTIVMTIDDARHLTDAMRAEMIARYANDPTAAATRLYGAEWAGGGLIFPNLNADILENRDPSTFPPYIKWILGLDPSHGGMSASAHPAGVILLAFDPFDKSYHVVDELRIKNALPSTLVSAILGVVGIRERCGRYSRGLAGTASTIAQVCKLG
jgi:phage terminase large subunit-like protein